MAKSTIHTLTKAIEVNNIAIGKMKEEVKSLAESKTTEAERLQNEQVISDATSGDPKTGNAGGRLIRFARIQEENKKIDKNIAEVETKIKGLEKQNNSYQNSINEYRNQFILEEN